MKGYTDYSLTIGNTPLVRINKLISSSVKVYGKVESHNPSSSVKARIGAGMIWDAEKSGKLRPGMEIVEPTSGNTGIALAFVGAARGYQVTLTMPETMSIERRKILAALGTSLILTDGASGMKGAINAATDMAEKNPDKYYMPQQFSNPSNPYIHETTTGPEIWNDTEGEVDVVVVGVGTGGTLTGISRYLKKQKKEIISIAVEPKASPVISQTLQGKELRPGPHKIQGIGAGFIPANLDLSLVDRVMDISDRDASLFARRLAQEEGLLSGISSGAAMAATARLAKDAAYKGKTIVVILPDSGERYLSTPLFGHLT